MKVSENWLREWTDPAINAQQIADQLTMAGLEVEALESLLPDFSDVVVGEIIAIEQHPDADKLRVCQVFDGNEIAQVVCGAPNARKGLKVAFARIGVRLPGDLVIKRAKLRGVESFGMLCSETELQLGEADSGLMELAVDAPVGKLLSDYLRLNDTVIELDITPNRGDCFSMLGVARELGVLNQSDVELPTVVLQAPKIADVFPVTIHASENCTRYVGRVVRNIDISQPSPAWLQEKLRRAGLRSIDAVVDVTNFLLLEFGQPMHAFDLQKLQGGIAVRLANAGEKLELLDGQNIELQEGSLLIADAEGPLALAGIMGGKRSAVTSSTRDIFFEAAFFSPDLLAGKARSYGLHTDSSHRFERGVDYTGQVRAVERATQLLLAITGGAAGPIIEVAIAEHLPKRVPIHLRRQRVKQMLGMELADDIIVDILQRLGLQLEASTGGWNVIPASWRFDISIEADLLEEIARIYGYNRLPSTTNIGALELKPSPEAVLDVDSLRDHMVARGYREAITYSFIAPELQVAFDPVQVAVPVTNPISADMGVMRTSLWPGLASTVAHNLNRQQCNIMLFEVGMRFVPTADGLQQDTVLAAVVCGQRDPDNWASAAKAMDFYDLKGDLETLLALSGRGTEFEFAPEANPALHPGQSAAILCRGEPVGWLGALHPVLQKRLDIDQTLYMFEIKIDAVTSKNIAKFAELSRFPAVRRDLAIVVDEAVPVAAVIKAVRNCAGELLTQLTVFDTYQGKGIEKQRKSLGLGLTFQHSSRTLVDEEINTIVGIVVAALEGGFAATLRN